MAGVGIVLGSRLRRWRRNPLLPAHHLATMTVGMTAVTAVVTLMLASSPRQHPAGVARSGEKWVHQTSNGVAFSSLRVAASVLYGVSPSDPMTVTWTIILLTVVGVSAGLIPALNAARTDPCHALRQE